MQRNRITEMVAIKWLIIANTIIGFSACASAQDELCAEVGDGVKG